MGTTTTIEVLPQNGTYLTLSGMQLFGLGQTTNTSNFNLTPGTYPITWTPQGGMTTRGSTTPIPATSREYPGLAMNAVLSFVASLDAAGNVTYNTQSATLQLTITSTSGTSGTNIIYWVFPYYESYTSNFMVRLTNGTVLTLSPSGRSDTPPLPGTTPEKSSQTSNVLY